jgi:hypothetical protein
MDSTTSRTAGALCDRDTDGRQRFARIKDGEIVGLYYHAEKPEQEGYVWLLVIHEDSEPFDIARHWRLTPHDVLEYYRVRRVYPVVPKSWEHA